MSILPKHLQSKEDLRNPVHYIHQVSASSRALCDVNIPLNDCIFGDLMYNNTPTYTFNEAEFESGKVAVSSHLTSHKHSGVDIYNLTSRLGVGTYTA